jgi:flagellar hook-associated protein 3 FlgL
MSSIYRISSNTIMDNGVLNIKNREYNMDKVNNQLATGQKYRLPSDGVVDVTQSMTFHSKILKTDQFLSNIQDAEGERALSETKMMNTIDVIQRIRELAVQGANGVYSADERKSMAKEVDELLNNVIDSANSR